jgi:lipopolysaccharide assembly outer membrane protein LptD (OstA)
MRFRPLFPLTVCIASSAVLVAVHAQGAKKPGTTASPVPAPAAVPDKAQNGVVVVHGETSISDDATGISKLTKNVTVTQVGEDFILYCQSLTYNRFKDRAIATDDLRIQTRDSTIRGARVDADFNTKILTLTGSIVIATHGKGDGITGNRPNDSLRSQVTNKASRIACDRVDWDYETHQATLTGNIHFTQGKATGTCDRILFDERQNVAELQGSVRFVDENGRVVHTPDLKIYMDENSMESGGATVWIPQPKTPGATPLPTKAPVPVKKGPKITDDDIKLFGVTPPPIPTARPEPTDEPAPPAPPAPTGNGG